MVLGVILLVSGWLLILPGVRRRRGLAVLGGLMVCAAMLSIVQGRY
jgi:hypothetical protein